MLTACFHQTLEWKTKREIPESYKGPFLIVDMHGDYEIMLTKDRLRYELMMERVLRWTLLPETK